MKKTPSSQKGLLLRAATARVVEQLESRTLFATVTLDPTETFQTIRGIGGNFAQGRFTGSPTPNDSVGKFTLDTLSVAHSRIGIPLKGWEPTNDDPDPFNANYDPATGGFVNSGNVANVFKLMKDLSDRNIPITVSVWDAPDWMVSNPTMSQDRLVPVEMVPELVESITTFIQTAVDVYGVETIDAVSFNESDMGYFLQFTAAEHAEVIKQSGPRLVEAGLGHVKWLVGDTAMPGGLYNYAKAILDDPEAAPYLGALSYHSWAALDTSDATFRKIAELGRQYGKEVWSEEVGYDSGLYRFPDQFKGWQYASRLARTYHKVIGLSQATVADYWEYVNDYPLADKSTLAPTYAYYVVRELAEGLTPGTQVFEADSDDASILTLAGKNVAKDTFMLQLINTSTSAKQVTINGLPSNALDLIRSASGVRYQNVGTYGPENGMLTLTLPADSVSTLRGRLGVPSPWSAGDVGSAGAAGRATYDNGRYRLRASGSGLDEGDTADAFQFVRQDADGNAGVIARLADLTGGPQAGLMIRGSTGANAAYVALVREADGTLALRGRAADGAAASIEFMVPPGDAGNWLRLVRDGGQVVASVSWDGDAWVDVGAVGVSLPTGTLVGLVAAGDGEATFDEVRVTALPVTLAPIGFSATVNAASHAEVLLDWTDLSGNEQGFEIQRSSDGGATFQTIATAPVNARAYADATVTPGARYVYRLRATNAAGASAWTQLARVRVGGYWEAESAPLKSGFYTEAKHTPFTGASYVVFRNATGSYIEWSFTAPEDGLYAIEFREAYTVDRSAEVKVDGAVVDAAFAFPKTQWLNSWAYRGLPAMRLSAGAHTVRITSNGQWAPNLDGLRLRPLTAGAPANFAAQPSGGDVRLSWDQDSSTDDEVYRVERSLDGIVWEEVGVTAANATGFTDTSVDPLVPYFYQVRASSLGGDSKYTARREVTVPPAPAVPGSLKAVARSTSQVELTWQDLAGDEDGYELQYSTNGASFAALATLPAGATQFTMSDLPAGRAHYFRVRALSAAAGPSAWAPVASAVTPLPPPTPVAATPLSPSRVGVTWGAVEGATGYVIERSVNGGAFAMLATVGAATGYTDAAAVPNSTVTYRVRATNDVAQSAFSAPGGAQTPPAVSPAVDAGADATSVEGQSVAFAGSFTDPDGPDGSHTYTWNFGDGSAEVKGTLTPTHTFAENGRYVVTLTVKDGDGAVGTDTRVVTVNNAAPVVDAGPDRTATEGRPVTFAGASFTDVGTRDTHTIKWDFGDGTTATGTLTPTKTFAAPGTYTVRLTVTDDDGGGASDTLRVTVAQTTFRLGTTATAYVRGGGYADKNYGVTGDLVVKRNNSTANTRESYLRFDLAGLPAAAVASAKLRLYGKLSDAGSVKVDAYASGDVAWGESSITWNNRPPTGTTVYASQTVSSTSKAWYEFDVTAAVQQARAAGQQQVTIVLKGANLTDPSVSFASDEATSASTRPELVVLAGEPGQNPTPQPPPQGLVVTPSSVSVPETGTKSFTVKLASAPTSNVTVTIARQSGGDTDLSADKATLTFTPSNWDVAQTVTIAAAADGDTTNGQAVFTVASSGLTSQGVTATEADNTPTGTQPIAIVSNTATYVRGGSHDRQNNGGDTDLLAKLASSANTRESFIKFDLSGLTAVTSAKLRLFGRVSGTVNPTLVTQVFSSTDTAWSESTLTYANRPAVDPAALGSITVAGTTAKWYELDLTAFLQSRLAAGATAVTLVLRNPTSSNDYNIFNSDDAGSNRPELVVQPGQTGQTPDPQVPQGLVVTPSTVSVPETGTKSFTVKLAAAPTSNVTVTVTKAGGGDADLSADKATLTFTPSNWDVAQTVTIAAAADGDTTNGQAVFTVASSGLTSQAVTATEADNTPAGGSQTVTVGTDTTTYARGGAYETRNFGSDTEILSKLASSATTREAFMKFDLSAVDTISSAKLRLFGRVSSDTDPSVVTQVFASSNTTWSEDTLTYANKPAVGATSLGSITVNGTTGQWYEADLTAFLQAQLAAGKRLVTLVLRNPTRTEDYGVFNSDDAASNRPELVIET